MMTRWLAAFTLVLIPLTASAAEPALDGNCPVCLVKMNKLVPGSKQHTITFDRQVFYFPSAKEKAMFAADPARFAPALGGDCVVCQVKMGVRMPGKSEYAVVHNDRIYLFPSAKEKALFQADPASYTKADLGLFGYCPICLSKMKQWVPGKPEHVSVYDGRRYLFPSAKEKAVFDAEPASFVPGLDGKCIVCFTDAGKHVAGTPEYAARYDGRVYLFPDAKAQAKFLANPSAYADADFANQGNCVVCEAMMQKQVPGKGLFTSVYKGQRYLFPSAKEQAMFDADPAKFADPNRISMVAPAEAAKLVRVTGTTACAGCAYGVRPLGDANSLGLAVVTPDKVYVVEGTENRYPELFRARFDELTVELQGQVKKTEGKFVWIEPVALRRSR